MARFHPDIFSHRVQLPSALGQNVTKYQKYKWGVEMNWWSRKWWAHQDLNLGPIDYESTALTN